ncbi:hypothetical protein ABCR94_36090 [Streptomyces sp. 21So2-11]|uniref:hypothetical protein n=1 Tax=Streptomyces sp. 21So2-11 TaxID=3144408 RepID=UPI00321A721E
MASTKANVRIELVKVHCLDTEDNLGGDEFYLVGGVIGGEHRYPVLTRPLDINEGQTVLFDQSEALMFQGELDVTDTLHVGVAAYDEDFSKDWGGKYGAALKQLTDAVNQVDPSSGNTGQRLIEAGEQTMTEIFSIIDPDDLLGRLTFSFPVSELHAGEKLWRVKGGTWMGRWEYEVTYRITKIPVA